MKKKNVIARMNAAKRPRGGFLRTQLLPALFCLFAALVIWLFAVQYGGKV